MIFEIARRVWQARAEKSVAMDFLRLGRFPVKDDVDLLRVRPEDSDRKIIPDAMRPQNPEWIPVRRRKERIQFVRRQSRDLKRLHRVHSSEGLECSTVKSPLNALARSVTLGRNGKSPAQRRRRALAN